MPRGPKGARRLRPGKLRERRLWPGGPQTILARTLGFDRPSQPQPRRRLGGAVAGRGARARGRGPLSALSRPGRASRPGPCRAGARRSPTLRRCISCRASAVRPCWFSSGSRSSAPISRSSARPARPRAAAARAVDDGVQGLPRPRTRTPTHRPRASGPAPVASLRRCATQAPFSRATPRSPALPH